MSSRTAEWLDAEADAFARWEPHIRSFVCRCAPTSEPSSGLLSGLTVGIKDIIDVAGVPTRNGSAAFADAPAAAQDAAVVAALCANGARIVGKTVTTEFAFTDPTDCRNPHDSTRSPGGSSSGSGAAVAAGLVDLALGTQTAGSLCRPAAYCGVVGLKPTYGVLPTDGVTPLARSFDSVGVIARSVDVARMVFRAMTDDVESAEGEARRAVRWLMPGDVRPVPASEALSKLCQIAEAPQLPIDTKTIVQAHRAVMLAEAAEAHGHLLSEPTVGLLRPKFRAGLEAGSRFEESQVDAARKSLHAAARKFWYKILL